MLFAYPEKEKEDGNRRGGACQKRLDDSRNESYRDAGTEAGTVRNYTFGT